MGFSFITPSNSADSFLHWLFAHAIDAGRHIHYPLRNLQMLQDVQEQVFGELRNTPPPLEWLWAQKFDKIIQVVIAPFDHMSLCFFDKDEFHTLTVFFLTEGIEPIILPTTCWLIWVEFLIIVPGTEWPRRQCLHDERRLGT